MYLPAGENKKFIYYTEVMIMVVQHNLSAMNANRMLGITTSGQSKSSEKLSSGYRINRAADDAAGLSISEKMRKQARGLTQASRNAQDGISAVQTAEGALNEVHSMLQRMNELAVQAANGTNSESDRQSIQDEIEQLTTEIDRVSETTKFNETYLLKGDNAAEKKINFQYKDAEVLSTDLYYLNGTTVETVKAGTYMSKVDTSLSYFSNATGKKVGESFTDTSFFTTTAVIGTDNYYKKSGTDYVLVAKGEIYDASATYYTISFTTDGKIASATKVTTASTATGYKAAQTIYDKNGTKINSGDAINTSAAPAQTEYFSTFGVGKFDKTDAVTLANYKKTGKVQFMDADGNEIAANGLYSYLDETGKLKGEMFLKGESGLKTATQEDVDQLVNMNDRYNTGALTLKLHVGADATSNNQITLEIDPMSAKGIGVEGITVAGKDDTNALDAVETISAALKRVSEQRSSLGAIQNRLEHTIANLDNVVENTTSAESRIRDTDMASEMVEYSKNNILAQAGQSMLAQANQSTQGVLSILG